jgi:DNA-binding XRE family transcriptional regulator
LEKEEQHFLYQHIGNQIKRLRIQSHFSQDQLAKKLNLSRVSIVNIEKGRQHPSLHLLIDCSRILNVNLNTLINDDILKDIDNQVKLNQIRKKISKTSNNIDQDKIMEFIKQITNPSTV